MSGARTGRDAVRTLARIEVRTRWREILVLGLVCGLLAAAAVATVTVLWRTETAYDRLVAATRLDDVRVNVFDLAQDPKQAAAAEGEAARTVATLRGDAATRGSVEYSAFIGQVRGPGVVYVSLSAPQRDPDVGRPVVVSGRAPDPGDPNEVMISEDRSDEFGYGVGDRLTLDLVTGRQFLAFGTGFGRPAGGTLPVRVTGVFRLPVTGTPLTSLYGSPALVREFSDTFQHVVSLRTSDPDTALRYAAARDAFMTRRFGPAPQPWVSVETPRASPDPDLAPTLTVLRSGLIALLVVVLVTGVLLTGQLAGRWAELTRSGQQVERALGMTTGARARARVLASLPAVALAAAMAAGGALLGGLIEPLGTIARFEPAPGWLARPLFAVVAAVITSAVVLAVVAVAISRAGTGSRERRVARSSPAGRLPVPLTVALARATGSPATALPLRSMLAGVTLLALAAAIVTGTHLRIAPLADQPTSFGWQADFGLLDDTPELDRTIAADPRVRDAERLGSAPVRLRLGGRTLTTAAYGKAAVTGNLPWTLAAGRAPTRDDEIALGPRLANETGLGVGDTVGVPQAVRGTKQRTGPLRVVGIVVVPLAGREALGNNVLMTERTLLQLTTAAYNTLLVRGADAAAADSLQASLTRSREIAYPAPPAAVSALDGLTDPTRILLGVLALAFAVLVVQNARLLARRRREQLAVVAAMGLSRPRIAAAAAGALALITVPALLVGAGLGWLACRIALVEMGPRLGLALPGPAGSALGWPLAAGAALTVVAAAGLALFVSLRATRSPRDAGATPV